MMPECRDRRAAHRHSIVGHPAPQDLSKPLALPVDPVVAGRHELLLDLPKFGSHALGHRLPSEHEAAAIPPGPAIMLEPQEVERLRLAEASSAAVRNCVPPKLDEPRLLGMKIQAKTSEPRLEVGKELLCFVPMLEANDGVVRVAHDNHVTGGASLPPLVDPLIIDMMEVNVRQERADDRALRRPLLRLDQVSIFEYVCRQPFADQPDNSPVANPMLDEADQPLQVNLVEKGLNVAIEYPVDSPLPDPERERIQRLMLVTLRSETVAEAQELRLIDRRQDCHHRCLDNLVLYGSDAERPLSAIRLRYVLPA